MFESRRTHKFFFSFFVNFYVCIKFYVFLLLKFKNISQKLYFFILEIPSNFSKLVKFWKICSKNKESIHLAVKLCFFSQCIQRIIDDNFQLVSVCVSHIYSVRFSLSHSATFFFFTRVNWYTKKKRKRESFNFAFEINLNFKAKKKKFFFEQFEEAFLPCDDITF